jgi:hypothetical protein
MRKRMIKHFNAKLNNLFITQLSTVTIYTGKGKNTATKLYWGMGWYVWNNEGDTASCIMLKINLFLPK